jgi:hypothetical protein
MKAMKVIEVDIPIYFGCLRIVVAKNFIKATKKLKVSNEGKDLNSFGAFVCESISNGKTYHNLFIRPNIDHDLIAHEVVHLVNSIYIKCHIILDPHNDEPQAYLTAWVTDQIYKALDR